MSGLILCTKKSDVPYRIKESDINIYSIEELAYYLYNNAYFTDNDFFSEDLIQYIEEKLGLKHIAEKLRTAQSQNLGFVADILIIIQESGYFTQQEVKEFKSQLKDIASKSMHERLGAKAKMLFGKGKYLDSKKIYQQILSEKRDSSLPESFYTNVYIQMAMIQCQMFYFDEAFRYLKIAYEREPQDEVLKKMTFVKLMEAKVKNVVSDLAELEKINKELVLQCKDIFFSTEEEIISSQEYGDMRAELQYDGSKDFDIYYEDVEHILNGWKKEYRECMNQNQT